ncbi:uncharacterized protein B0H18DRAFT_969438 [Fomitopsis serialis]|uniref:uncharacterized protein n=1 Tax=Fomitopsis serialis TaxID=139415 RepID=UPI0020086AC0|nr:uncharacterized protein B0H18DRAFT_969438 [Neoantrodia serialis]KAH9937175.1 hypothetical protein B0H18DRAFT_969438 [Neoantrodia serialis]
MPKASSSATRASGEQPFQAAHVLRRNQACHQCRRRKLKCDAKRPCSTCVRSHSYAVAHAPPGAELPPNPHCTFDEVSEDDEAPEIVDNPKARFERLENRINELESLLREKDKGPTPQSSTASHRTNGATHAIDGLVPGTQPNNTTHLPRGYGSESYNSAQMVAIDPALSLPEFQSGSPLDNLAGVASLMGAPGPSRITNGSPTTEPSTTTQVDSPDHDLDIMYSSWPRDLPNPNFLRHLVDAFFSYHPDATRMFHQPTFLSTLLLHPTHPRFPFIGLLHAICAVGSMYTAAVPSPAIPSGPEFSPYDVFSDRWRVRNGIIDSFPEVQAKFSKAAIDASMQDGGKLFQTVQAVILLAWWYWANAKWSDAYLLTSHALRYAVPCGLNVCPPFHTIAEPVRPPSLLPPASTVVEDEMRRNTFWIGYAIERCHGTANGWAMTLDDQDVSQLLPLRRDQFEQGILVLPQERQWSHDKDMLIKHPEDQVDGFILFVKATMILSRVKNFNMRFRSKHHSGDPSAQVINNLFPPPHACKYSDSDGEPMDPRQTAAFLELDQLVTAFRSSFPVHLRNPAKEQVDAHLFSAITAAHLADILLHESHAVIGRKNCVSSCRILNAARAMLDLLYQVNSTSYDLTFLSVFPVMCWFMAGRVFVRFLLAAINQNSEEQCLTIWAEVDYIRTAMFRVGAHVPLAHRYGSMLHDLLVQSCGDRYAGPAPMMTQSIPDVDIVASQNNVYGASLQAIPTPPS